MGKAALGRLRTQAGSGVAGAANRALQLAGEGRIQPPPCFAFA